MKHWETIAIWKTIYLYDFTFSKIKSNFKKILHFSPCVLPMQKYKIL